MLTIPTDPTTRVKFFVALGVTVLCVGWLVFYSATHLSFKGPTKAPDTPGWKIAGQINAELLKDPAFLDAGMVVESEKPLKFKVQGAVHNQAELDRLEAKLKELRPEGDYDVSVELFQNKK